jgi:hypothetical protein
VSQKDFRQQEISKQSHMTVEEQAEFAELTMISSGVDLGSLEFENHDDGSTFPRKFAS